VNGIKIVPAICFDYFTAVSLAFMIMGDGGKSSNGLTLHLESFSLHDKIFLINLFHIKFGIPFEIRERDRGYTVLHCRSEYMP